MTISYNATGNARKKLVTALKHHLASDSDYLGAPTFAYEIGEYHVSQNGTVTGPDNPDLVSDLSDRFTAAAVEYDAQTAEAGADTAEGYEGDGVYYDSTEEYYNAGFANAEKASKRDFRETEASDDRLTIDMPLEGFTPEALENLTKLVLSKEVLIKKALGVEELPIKVLADRVSFPWFKFGVDTEHIEAYAQFIAGLCKTAKEKKRVTAKAQEAFENEKFAMRVWLIGLGLVGKDFALARKLLSANLGGNSGWRYGAPDKAASANAAPAPADETAPTSGETEPESNGEEEAVGDE